MSNQDPLIQILTNRLAALEAKVERLQNNSVRSEITGALSRITFAELPAAGIAGRLFYITDVEQGMIYYDNSIEWVPLTGSYLVFAVGDQGAFVNPGVVITGIAENPTVNPGWANSDTVPMTPPDINVKLYVDGAAYSVPGWNI